MWFSDDNDDEEDVQRPTWNIFQFGLAVLCSMSLPVFVKFPLNHYFGSGWAIVMFVVFLIVFAAPLIFIQIRLGCQFRRGLLGIFDKFFPLSLGFGIGTMIRNLISIIYISGIMAHCLSYLFFSVYPCDGRHCVGAKFIWGACKDQWNQGDCEDGGNKILRGPTAEDGFYYNFVLKRTDDITYSGDFPRWFERDGLPVIPHLISWGIFTLVVIGGAKAFGYILYFLGSLAVLLYLIVMALVLEKANFRGQWDTFVSRFFKTFASTIPLSSNTWDQYRFEPLVWGILGTFVQMSLSLNLWTGVYPLMGKYLGRGKIKMNVAWIIVIVIFGVFGLLPTITMVGALSSTYDMDYLRCHIAQGIGTPFVILTHIFTQFSFHRITAYIYFLAFYIFLLLSQALLFIVVLEGIIDRLRHRSRQVAKHVRRSYLIGCAIALPILFVLSFTTVIRSAYYWLYLIDFYLDRMMVLLIIGLSIGLIVSHGRAPSGGVGVCKILLIVHLVIVAIISVGIFIWYAADAGQKQPTQQCELTRFTDGYNTIPGPYRGIGWMLALCPFVIGVPIGLFSICCRREEESESMQGRSARPPQIGAYSDFSSGHPPRGTLKQLSARNLTTCWPYIIHGDYMSPTEYMEDYHPKQPSSYPSSQRPAYHTEMHSLDSRSPFTDI